jgi:hypothetical protein
MRKSDSADGRDSDDPDRWVYGDHDSFDTDPESGREDEGDWCFECGSCPACCEREHADEELWAKLRATAEADREFPSHDSVKG